MFLASLNDRELETLILALKYWRSHRRGQGRRTDRVLSLEELDLLLTKLGCSNLTSWPTDALPPDLFPR
jgi:hypothetical protein